MSILFSAMLPFIVAALVPLMKRSLPNLYQHAVSLAPLLLFVFFLQQMTVVASNGPQSYVLNWVPSLGISLSFYIDGLSVLFALLITGIGFLISIYAFYYFKENQFLERFYVLLYLFMGAMLGIVISDNFLMLFVFWELTSLTSYLLIGFKHEDEDSRKSALQALLVTGAGGLTLLLGLVIIGNLFGTYEFSTLLSYELSEQSANPLFNIAVVLIVIGAMTKSAQFPFHFWLPNAMEAPTPVSAYLHSATMVKAGVYLVARCHPLFAENIYWQVILILSASVTMLIGSYLSLRRSDLKQILAYTTVASLGIMIFLIALGTEASLMAALIFILAHALYKGALFMLAGIVDKTYGTRDIEKLSGIGCKLPVLSITAALAGLSMLGAPPFIGFLAKETIYGSLIIKQEIVFLFIAMLAFAGLGASALLVSYKIFWKSTVETSKIKNKPSMLLICPALVLSLLSLLLVPFLVILEKELLNPALGSLLAKETNINLVLWHGFNLALGLSGITIVAAILLYLASKKIRDFKLLDIFERIGPEKAYNILLNGLMQLAKAQTQILQNGYLRNYLLSIVIFTLGLLIFSFLRHDQLFLFIEADFNFVSYEILVVLMMITALLTLLSTKSRLSAVASLGVIGFGMVLFFIMFSAPDLAMTQFSIETLSVILFIFALYQLPRFSRLSSNIITLRDSIVAGLFGFSMMLLILMVTNNPMQSRIAPYFAENSYILAKGRNVVNVILVDFRALDTLGEITVIAIAALGVVALLKLRPTPIKGDERCDH